MIVVHAERCPQNHRCPVLRVCPVGALSQPGYGLPVVDESKCTDCGLCARACPTFQLDRPRTRRERASA